MTNLNEEVAAFLAQYRRDWAAAGNTSDDARHFAHSSSAPAGSTS